MDNNIKYLSEMEKYEIININDGEKYSYLGNNDMVVDNNGNLKVLLLSETKAGFSIFKSNNVLEVPFEYVRKIGSRTIIIDIDNETLGKSNI